MEKYHLLLCTTRRELIYCHGLNKRFLITNYITATVLEVTNKNDKRTKDNAIEVERLFFLRMYSKAWSENFGYNLHYTLEVNQIKIHFTLMWSNFVPPLNNPFPQITNKTHCSVTFTNKFHSQSLTHIPGLFTNCNNAKTTKGLLRQICMILKNLAQLQMWVRNLSKDSG